MSRRETIRDEAERRGVSRGKIFNERKAQDRIDKMGGDVDIVYAWRWSNDQTCAKIGVAKVSNLESRMVTTYHPTDDPVLIGVMKCRSRAQAEGEEWGYLNNLFERTHPNREWVIIDELFKDVIDEAFISDPSELEKMFGKHIKTEKSCNENS